MDTSVTTSRIALLAAGLALLGHGVWARPAIAAENVVVDEASTASTPQNYLGSIELSVPATRTSQIDGRIGFAPKGTQLDADARSALHDLAQALKGARYRLYFARDTQAESDRSADALALKRARAVRDYLVAQGLDPHQMAVVDAASVPASLRAPCINRCTQPAHTLKVFAIAEVDGMLIKRGSAVLAPAPDAAAAGAPARQSTPATEWY